MNTGSQREGKNLEEYQKLLQRGKTEQPCGSKLADDNQILDQNIPSLDNFIKMNDIDRDRYIDLLQYYDDQLRDEVNEGRAKEQQKERIEHPKNQKEQPMLTEDKSTERKKLQEEQPMEGMRQSRERKEQQKELKEDSKRTKEQPKERRVLAKERKEHQKERKGHPKEQAKDRMEQPKEGNSQEQILKKDRTTIKRLTDIKPLIPIKSRSVFYQKDVLPNIKIKELRQLELEEKKKRQEKVHIAIAHQNAARRRLSMSKCKFIETRLQEKLQLEKFGNFPTNIPEKYPVLPPITKYSRSDISIDPSVSGFDSETNSEEDYQLKSLFSPLGDNMPCIPFNGDVAEHSVKIQKDTNVSDMVIFQMDKARKTPDTTTRIIADSDLDNHQTKKDIATPYQDGNIKVSCGNCRKTPEEKLMKPFEATQERAYELANKSDSVIQFYDNASQESVSALDSGKAIQQSFSSPKLKADPTFLELQSPIEPAEMGTSPSHLSASFSFSKSLNTEPKPSSPIASQPIKTGSSSTSLHILSSDKPTVNKSTHKTGPARNMLHDTKTNKEAEELMKQMRKEKIKSAIANQKEILKRMTREANRTPGTSPEHYGIFQPINSTKEIEVEKALNEGKKDVQANYQIESKLDISVNEPTSKHTKGQIDTVVVVADTILNTKAKDEIRLKCFKNSENIDASEDIAIIKMKISRPVTPNKNVAPPDINTHRTPNEVAASDQEGCTEIQYGNCRKTPEEKIIKSFQAAQEHENSNHADILAVTSDSAILFHNKSPKELVSICMSKKDGQHSSLGSTTQTDKTFLELKSPLEVAKNNKSSSQLSVVSQGPSLNSKQKPSSKITSQQIKPARISTSPNLLPDDKPTVMKSNHKTGRSRNMFQDGKTNKKAEVIMKQMRNEKVKKAIANQMDAIKRIGGKAIRTPQNSHKLPTDGKTTENAEEIMKQMRNEKVKKAIANQMDALKRIGGKAISTPQNSQELPRKLPHTIPTKSGVLPPINSKDAIKVKKAIKGDNQLEHERKVLQEPTKLLSEVKTLQDRMSKNKTLQRVTVLRQNKTCNITIKERKQKEVQEKEMRRQKMEDVIATQNALLKQMMAKKKKNETTIHQNAKCVADKNVNLSDNAPKENLSVRNKPLKIPNEKAISPLQITHTQFISPQPYTATEQTVNQSPVPLTLDLTREMPSPAADGRLNERGNLKQSNIKTSSSMASGLNHKKDLHSSSRTHFFNGDLLMETSSSRSSSQSGLVRIDLFERDSSIASQSTSLSKLEDTSRQKRRPASS